MPTAPFFNILDSVDSTNNYAMAKVHEGLASHGMAWFTATQTGGRGQRGKNWISQPGKNIALSLVLQPPQFIAAHQFFLSATVSLACHEFVLSYAGEGTRIKWPNDLYWCDRKAGGILIENVFMGKVLKYTVVGIGININQTRFDPALTNPVSLKQITGKDFDLMVLAKELYTLLIKRTANMEIAAFDQLMKTYNHHLYASHDKVRLKKDNAVFETEIIEVNKKGQLITFDTIERSFNFGEVEWIKARGEWQ